MSRIRSITLAAAALAVAGTLLSAPAQAAPSGSLTVYTTRTEWKQIDLPPTGDTTGDLTVGAGNVSKTQGGAVIGSIAYNATTVRINMPGGMQSRLATQWVTLPGGSIESSSLVEAPQGTPPVKMQTFIIVGGTGKYAGARGTMTLTPVTATENKLVFRFIK